MGSNSQSDSRKANPFPLYSPCRLWQGYKIPEFLALWSPQRDWIPGHMKGWQHDLLRYASANKFRYLQAYSCGNCHDCRGQPPAPHNRTGGRMHLFELAAANRALLQYLIDAEKLSRRVTLHHLAASNHSHSMLAFKGLLAGDERGTGLMGKKASRFITASATETVPAVALDDFLIQQRLDQVYHVAIDTEGWDALVVEGLMNTIRKRRVALVEFEVNNRGMWRAGRDTRKVESTLHGFHEAQYSCFWVLTHALLPASGACWIPEYGGKPMWSNILCAHESPVVAALNKIAREGFDARRLKQTEAPFLMPH